MKYGWYSKEMHRYLSGLPGTEILKGSGRTVSMPPSVIYRGEDGSEVLCTTVTDAKGHKCGYDDMQFVGMVTGFIRAGPPLVEIDPEILKQFEVKP